MEANKPSRQRKRKRDLSTSSLAAGVETTSKRRKRQEAESSLQEPRSGVCASRQEQHVDMGATSEASDSMDQRDKGLELDEEGTSSDINAETKDSSDTEDVKDPVSRFPDLIQEKIFGFLNLCDKIQAAQVCSDWCLAVNKPCLWRHEKVSIYLDGVTKEELLSLSEREVSQIEVRGRNKSKLKFLLETFPSLVSLHIESKAQTDIFLQKVSKCEFSSLKELSVIIESSGGHVPSSLQQSLSRLSSLRTISIKGRVTSDLVQAISRELHGLEKLSLHLKSGNLDATAISIKELKSLKCLQSLRLQDVALQDLSDFCQQNTRLKILLLDHCVLPAADWPAELAKLTSLEELSLMECSPKRESLEPLQNLMKLKKLLLLPSKGGDWLSVAKISSLEGVVLQMTSKVTNDQIHALGSNLTHLKALRLHGGLSSIPPEVFVYFAGLPSLQSLRLVGSHTDDFVKILSEGSCNLRSLVMRFVGLKRPLELKHLAQISSLREVNLDCIKVSSAGLSSSQQEIFQLETLELCHCGVTVESVMPLLQTQTSLRKLVMRGKEVREGGQPSLYALLPNLEVCVLEMINRIVQ